MVSRVSPTERKPRKLWWLVGVMVFAFFVLVQMPAAWIVHKYAPQQTYLQYVSGSLWQGSAVWQLPVRNTATAVPPLSGTVQWQWQPWRLLLGKFGADIRVQSAQTRLSGQLHMGSRSWSVYELSGKISPETMTAIAPWQFPDTSIVLNQVTLQRTQHGFIDADGQLSWSGGQLGYPSAGKTYRINLPAMHGQLSSEKKGDTQRLHLSLLDSQDKRLGEFYVDEQNMLDVALTQRLLQYMPEYKGQAPQDTAVVTIRQPLSSGLSATGGH